MQLLKANTAVDVLLGPFLDDGDGNATEEGLTIEDEHVLLSKNGQALTAKAETTNAGHDDLGYYNCPLGTDDLDTEGSLVICCHMSGALTVRHEFMVLAEAAYDSLFAAKDAGFMDVNIKSIGRTDTQETEATNLEAACAAYSVTRGLTGTAVPAAAADAGGGLLISDDGGWDADEISDAIIADAAGANIAVDIIALKAETVEIVTDTGTTIPGTITTAQNDLDIITGASGVVIQDGTIVATSLGADCITNAKIADNALNTEQFAADFLEATLIADDAIVAANLATGAITADAFAADAIVAATLNTGAITADAFAADAIVAATLATGALSADAFAADALVAATFATGAFTADAFAANALVAATFNADCLTAAKIAADVHTEGAAAVWAASNSTLTKAYSLIMEQIYQFLHNDMNITDATGAIALRNLANDGDMATWGITDDDTTTARTDVVWA